MERVPGMISLLFGKPNGSMFPFTSFTFKAKSPYPADKSDPSKDAESEMELTIEGAELDEALQYYQTAGLHRLLDWLTRLQEVSHTGRKLQEGSAVASQAGLQDPRWRVSIGAGSQDLIFKALANIFDPGDSILVESPVYAGVIPMFSTYQLEVIPVLTDSEGIQADSLEQILSTWPAGKPKPKGLYTVPFGCNPTGASATLERRKKVLNLAREHDFMILEDDPYFYLYFGDAPRAPSYFSLDETRSRVLRFDSLSKVLSAGIRIGWMTGPPVLLEVIEMHTEISNLQTSTLTQAIVHKLLVQWGIEGFLRHTEKVAAFYRRKRDVFESAMKKHLSGVAEWSPPQAGMFYWFKISDDSEAFVRARAFEEGVLALPGTAFIPEKGAKTGYVRAAFSIPTDAEVDEALRRFRRAYDKSVDAISKN